MLAQGKGFMAAGKSQGPSGQEKIMMALVRAAELFKRRSSAIFKSQDLTFSQYNVLRVLEASQGGKKAINEVSKTMLSSAPNLSGIAKRLEKGGFITRESLAQDERVKLLGITAKGRRVLGLIAREQEENIHMFLRGSSQKKRDEMLAILRNMLKLD